MESMLVLEHEAIAEEGWDCWAFMEVSAVILWACLPETCGALVYPLQLLTGNVPLSTTQLQAADVSSFHLQCIGDASTSNGCKMVALFICSGSIHAKARGNSWTRWNSQVATSSKMEGGEIYSEAPKRELLRGFL